MEIGSCLNLFADRFWLDQAARYKAFVQHPHHILLELHDSDGLNI